MVDGGSAIAAALALEAAGDPLRAIAVLSAAEAQARDPAAEKLLVRLRRDAFGALQRSAHAQPLPRVVAEPVTGPVAALPALRREELSAPILRAAFARHGCAYVPGFVPPDAVARLVAGIDRALAACDAALAGAPESETAPWFVPFDSGPGGMDVAERRKWIRAGGGLWAVESPRMLCELVEILEALGVGALVTDLLGERPALSANKCNLRRVPAHSGGDWHQDGAFLGEEIGTVNFWLALDHCGRDAPTMDIVPRRLDHVVQTGTAGAHFEWAVAPDVARAAAGEAGVLRPEFAPGDVLFFDHLFLHRTATTPEMRRDRHAIEAWFFAPSTYPPSGQIPIVY